MRNAVFLVFIVGVIPTIFLHPYVGVLLWSWLSFMSPQRLAYGFSNSLPLAMIVGAGTLLCWLASKEPKKPKLDATFWLIAAFMAYVSLTTLFAFNPAAAYKKWDLTFKALLFVLVTITMTTNRVRVHSLVWVMIIAIGFYGLKSGSGAIMSGGGGRVYGPPDTMIGDNNHFAVALLVALPLMNYVRMNSAQRIVRLGLPFLMGLCLVATLASYSRGALLGLGAVSLFLWLKSKRKLLPAIIIPLAVVSAIKFMPEQWFARMNTMEHYEEDGSATGRLSMWETSYKIALARPFTGAGFVGPYMPEVVQTYNPGTTPRAVHSIYFEVIGEHGFVAFAIWALIPVVGWRNARWVIKRSRDQPEWRWANDLARMMQVSLIGYLVGGTFLSLSYWDYYFTIIGILAAMRHMMEKAFAEQAAPAGSIETAVDDMPSPVPAAVPAFSRS